MIGHLARLLRRVRANRKGNVLMITAFAIIPLTFSVGMGIDYARAARLQTKLNALADAAALAAVTSPMMNQSTATAATAVKNYWAGQAVNQEGMLTPYSHSANVTSTSTSYDSDDGNIHLTVTDTNTTGLARTATVAWHAASLNRFGTILGSAQIEISGTSTTIAKQAPDIDFYLVLDDSPSMAIAATQSGIDTMVANTLQQPGGQGCAFGCHQSSPNSKDNQGNPTDPNTGKIMDNYALAASLGVTLRMDLVTKAASDVVSTAQTTSQNNGATYRMSVSTFDTAFTTLSKMTDGLPAAKTAAGKVKLQVVCKENQYVCNTDNADEDTNMTAMQNGLTGSSGIVTKPGNGTKVPGDKPQGFIFIVTDGVRGESNSSTKYNRWVGEFERSPSTYPYPSNTTNDFTTTNMDPQFCENAKSQGLKIAVLYTEYLPLPTNDFYNKTVGYFQSQIDDNLKACASPGLYYKVTTGGDVSAALTALFQAAVSSARITH